MKLTDKQMNIECYHNIYKSIYGVRPRHIDFDALSIEDLDLAIDDLDKIQEAHNRQEADDKRGYSLEDIEVMIACGAQDQRQAIQWARQANH
jgi:hypothetical protein